MFILAIPGSLLGGLITIGVAVHEHLTSEEFVNRPKKVKGRKDTWAVSFKEID